MSHHSHCDHNGCTCPHGNQGHCCACSHCHDHSSQHEHCHFSDQLLEMADDAWMEVLKEKIKEQVRQKSGAHLDKLAKIVAEANNDRWQRKLELMDIAHNFADRVRSFFSGKK